MLSAYVIISAIALCVCDCTDVESTANSANDYNSNTTDIFQTYFSSSQSNPANESDVGCIMKFLKAKEGNQTSLMTIPLITFTASTVGNIIAIFVIWRNQNRSNKQSGFYTLVMALACLDLISTLATSPVTFMAYSKQTCVYDIGGDVLCKYSGFTMVFFGIASMALVFFMAIERMIAVRFAFFYQTKVTVKRTKITIIAIIAFFLVISALPLLGFGAIEQQFPGTWCFLHWKSHNPVHQAFNLLIAVMGSAMMAGTVFCNGYVVIRVITKRRKMKLRNSTMQILSKQKLRKLAYQETQMIVLLALMTSIFVVCYLPLLLSILINQARSMMFHDHASRLSRWDRFAVWMAAINPVLDPWVYILCRRSTIVRFFKLTKLAITCQCSKEEVQGAFGMGRDYKRRALMSSLRSNRVTEIVPLREVSATGRDEAPKEKKYAQIWKNKALKNRELQNKRLQSQVNQPAKLK